MISQFDMGVRYDKSINHFPTMLFSEGFRGTGN